MAKAQTQDAASIKKSVIQSSLDLAADTPWADVTMHDIASHAKIEMAQMVTVFDDKIDILNAFGKQIDVQVATAMNGQVMADDSHKDKLFDVLMERFDVLNENRAAIISILNATTADPKQMVVAMPWICRSMNTMMDLADIPTNGWAGALRVMGVSGVYLKTLRIWISDETDDMAVTMNELDTNLSRGEKIAGYFNI
jgi:ubiquinone biosynthesis protein COQ9